MPVTITLTDDQIRIIVASLGPQDGETSLLAAEIKVMRERLQGIEMISEQRACGLLDVSRSVLLKSGIPRVQIVPGTFRYRVADVEAFLKENLERTE